MSDRSLANLWPTVGAGRQEWTVRVVEPERDDQTLVAASLAGDRTAFDAIVERHRRAIYQICFRFVNHHEDASDLAQETFLRAWKGLGTFKGHAALSTWLYRIAVNVCLNRVSGRRLDVEPLDSDRYIDPSAELPGTDLIRRERAEAVRRAITELPEKQRATLILRAYHEMSHQEIADVLGSSVGAVKANFFHALANLKKVLEREP